MKTEDATIAVPTGMKTENATTVVPTDTKQDGVMSTIRKDTNKEILFAEKTEIKNRVKTDVPKC
jgi:hypothetical protein